MHPGDSNNPRTTRRWNVRSNHKGLVEVVQEPLPSWKPTNMPLWLTGIVAFVPLGSEVGHNLDVQDARSWPKLTILSSRVARLSA